VDYVTDGEHVLAYLRRQGIYAHAPTPDLIILDLDLPRKDGWAVIRELGMTPELRDIPVVVFTGVLTPATEQQLTALGVARAVQKPIDLASYESVLREILAWWHSRRDPQVP
jgi:two-component system response regulator